MAEIHISWLRKTRIKVTVVRTLRLGSLLGWIIQFQKFSETIMMQVTFFYTFNPWNHRKRISKTRQNYTSRAFKDGFPIPPLLLLYWSPSRFWYIPDHCSLNTQNLTTLFLSLKTLIIMQIQKILAFHFKGDCLMQRTMPIIVRFSWSTSSLSRAFSGLNLQDTTSQTCFITSFQYCSCSCFSNK